MEGLKISDVVKTSPFFHSYLKSLPLWSAYFIIWEVDLLCANARQRLPIADWMRLYMKWIMYSINIMYVYTDIDWKSGLVNILSRF